MGADRIVGYRTPTEDTYYAVVDDRPGLLLLERRAIDFLISQLRFRVLRRCSILME